jgi:hypothetical protein
MVTYCMFKCTNGTITARREFDFVNTFEIYLYTLGSFPFNSINSNSIALSFPSASHLLHSFARLQ